VPAWRRPVMSRRSRRDDRQQRQDDNNRQEHEARHKHTIDGRPSGGDSNLSAQSSATACGSLAKRPHCATSGRSHSKSRTAACLLIFPPHLDGTNGKVSIQMSTADGRSVPARARGNVIVRLTCAGTASTNGPSSTRCVQTLGRLALPSRIYRCSVCSAE
jgi:hypothetical protein